MWFQQQDKILDATSNYFVVNNDLMQYERDFTYGKE